MKSQIIRFTTSSTAKLRKMIRNVGVSRKRRLKAYAEIIRRQRERGRK